MPCWSRKPRYVAAGNAPHSSGASDHSAAEIAPSAREECESLAEESPVPRIEQAPAVGEHRRERFATPFELTVRYRERHRGVARCDPELVEQRAEPRIARAVVHDESEVHREP